MTLAASWTVAGLDLGGTAIRAAIRCNGALIASCIVPTADFDGLSPAVVVERLAAMIRDLLPTGAVLSAVGIGASGPVDRHSGTIRNVHTLPYFSGFRLVDWLGARLACPVVIDNDAMVAALAEHRIGAGRGASRMLMVTLGTGIGVALLIAGQPFRGLAEAHPEGGHISVMATAARCYCGAQGCWEQAASRTALQNKLQAHASSHGDPDRLIVEAAAMATAVPAIAMAFHEYGRSVGRGLAVLHTLYMPDVTILGGSAAAYLDLFRAGLSEALARSADFGVAALVQAAELEEPGAVGAALMAETFGAESGVPASV